MPGGGVVGTGAHRGLSPSARAGEAVTVRRETLVDADGILCDTRVSAAIAPAIERGPLGAVKGIIVHQTGGATAQSALDSYRQPGANGAHFLIDKDGAIYQTASLHRRTWHVGKLKARCLVEQRCTPVEIQAYRRFDPTAMNRRESLKSVPGRFPSNADSIGIELVGQAVARDPAQPAGELVYEAVTDQQNASLTWLVAQLTRLLAVPMSEVFRHPDVSWKNPSEASTARWQ
ncbi:N-acetylmuramoyl-L-alanine amidase [Rubrivivax gelatinosus]|nr:N-acetylmuramoyl-L-alanine amidase [Rubrivivax gelatinosus]